MAERASSRRVNPNSLRRDLSVYDGRTLLGHVREEGGWCGVSTWPDGRDLSEFPNRKRAFDAIGGAARQARGRTA